MHLPKVLERHRGKIEDVSDERGSGDGYWIYLARGWQNSADPGCHIIHEDSPTECAKAFLVEPCDCADCVKIGASHDLQ